MSLRSSNGKETYCMVINARMEHYTEEHHLLHNEWWARGPRRLPPEEGIGSAFKA